MRNGDIEIDKCVDRNFVWELSKRGNVRVFTRQVEIRGTEIDLKGIKLPKGIEMQYASAKPDKYDQNAPEVRITFGWPIQGDALP